MKLKHSYGGLRVHNSFPWVDSIMSNLSVLFSQLSRDSTSEEFFLIDFTSEKYFINWLSYELHSYRMLGSLNDLEYLTWCLTNNFMKLQDGSDGQAITILCTLGQELLLHSGKQHYEPKQYTNSYDTYILQKSVRLQW